MPVQNKSSGSERWILNFPRFTGLFTTASGILVIAGWYFHWTFAVHIFQDAAPMQYNTALCFILCGIALILLKTRRADLSPCLGGLAAATGFVTFIEYAARTDLGIDKLFFEPYQQTTMTYPGRMSALTAICFICLGTSIGLSALKRSPGLRLAGAGVLACMTMAIALIGVCSYLAGTNITYGVLGNARMAVHTALLFIVIASGLATWIWRQSRTEQFNMFQWVPLIGSLTLMVMIAVITTMSFDQLQTALHWRTHSDDVLVESQQLLGDIFASQRGMRNYVMTGLPEARDLSETGATNASLRLDTLQKLTSDNPMQQEHLRLLQNHLDGLLAYSRHLVDLRTTNGLEEAIQLESTGEGFQKINKVLMSLDVFTRTERTLLDNRSLTVEDSFHDVSRLLGLGSLAAAGMLMLANITAGREARRRGQAELEQLALTAQLSRTTALQNAILYSANYAIISTDTHGVVTTFNAAAERWLGYLASEVVGKKTPETWHDHDEVVARAKMLSEELGSEVKPGFETFVAKARLGGADENQWTYVRKDGKRFPVSLSVTAMTDEAGRVTGFLGVIADITERKQVEERLRENEERFRLIVEGVSDYALYMLDTKGRVATWNSGAEKLKGYKAEEIIGQNFSKFYPPDDVADGKPARELDEALLHGHVHDEGWRVRKDGSQFYAHVLITAVYDSRGNHRGFSKVTRDITESRRAEQALQTSEQRLRLAAEAAGVAVWEWDVRNDSLKWDEQMFDMYGLPPTPDGRADYQDWASRVLPEDLPKQEEILRQTVTECGQSEREFRISRASDDAIRHVQSAELVLADEHGKATHVIGINVDITERKLAEKKIADSLREKEALLREIHHRVKNNMQVISSILQLQTNYIKDREALEVFKDCQNRIRTMALIHEKLYRSEGMAQVDFKDYLGSLLALLLRSQTARAVILRHELQVEAITLDVDTAIPLGLIANELVSNCLKHAFTGQREGFMRVLFQRIGEDRYRFTVQDNGKGLPDGFDPDKTTSLGMRLVKILSSQIKGTAEFGNDGGSKISVTFESDKK